jgi:hypothetical protein
MVVLHGRVALRTGGDGDAAGCTEGSVQRPHLHSSRQPREPSNHTSVRRFAHAFVPLPCSWLHTSMHIISFISLHRVPRRNWCITLRVACLEPWHFAGDVPSGTASTTSATASTAAPMCGSTSRTCSTTSRSLQLWKTRCVSSPGRVPSKFAFRSFRFLFSACGSLALPPFLPSFLPPFALRSSPTLCVSRSSVCTAVCRRQSTR